MWYICHGCIQSTSLLNALQILQLQGPLATIAICEENNYGDDINEMRIEHEDEGEERGEEEENGEKDKEEGENQSSAPTPKEQKRVKIKDQKK